MPGAPKKAPMVEPTELLFAPVCGAPTGARLMRLKMLNISARNWKTTREGILVSLTTEKSTSEKPGLEYWLRRWLLIWPGAGSEKAAELNHWAEPSTILWETPAKGETPVTLARSALSPLPSSSALATTLNGWPPCRLIALLSSHPAVRRGRGFPRGFLCFRKGRN